MLGLYAAMSILYKELCNEVYNFCERQLPSCITCHAWLMDACVCMRTLLHYNKLQCLLWCKYYSNRTITNHLYSACMQCHNMLFFYVKYFSSWYHVFGYFQALLEINNSLIPIPTDLKPYTTCHLSFPPRLYRPILSFFYFLVQFSSTYDILPRTSFIVLHYMWICNRMHIF